MFPCSTLRLSHTTVFYVASYSNLYHFLIDWQLKRCWMMIFWRDIRPYFKIKSLFCTDPFSGHFLRGV